MDHEHETGGEGQTQPSTSEPDPTQGAVYSCPMHPEETSAEPGKCSKCGMFLAMKDKEHEYVYSCPTHPEISSDKPGKCSKCDKLLAGKVTEHGHNH